MKRGKPGFCSVRQVTHAFPAVLERLQLPAFDMSKLVGTFVRHISPAEQVPRELKRHLFSIEEKILEQQAWERGSSLYPLLTSACAAPPSDSGGAPRVEADTVMDESPPVTSRKVCPRFSTALSQRCWPTFTKKISPGQPVLYLGICKCCGSEAEGDWLQKRASGSRTALCCKPRLGVFIMASVDSAVMAST
jgi:hypothetical protein